jgi:hypothetical protein
MIYRLQHHLNPAIICLQEPHLHPSHALNRHGYMAHCCYHFDGDRANRGMAI